MRDNNTAEDNLVLSKAKDTISLSQKYFKACFFGFLNEHQAQLIKDSLVLDDNSCFWGGYKDAQRVIFGANTHCFDDFPISTLKFVYKPQYELTHRDFLGSIMSLGIDRSTVGDILVMVGKTYVFVKKDISDYIMQEISKIGRVGVSVVECSYNDVEYVNEFDIIQLTLSSLRLDVFVSAVCSLSREKSQSYVKSDMVSVNHHIDNNVSHTLKIGDVITIRKYGKFVFIEENGFSKKGKFRISVKHFR